MDFFNVLSSRGITFKVIAHWDKLETLRAVTCPKKSITFKHYIQSLLNLLNQEKRIIEN